MAQPIRIASYNIHGGVDAWGRPVDVVEAARAIDADIYLLQENWIGEDGRSAARELSAQIGGSLIEVPLASGRRGLPHPEAASTWHRSRAFADGDHALYVDSEVPLRGSLADSRRFREAEPGSWGVAIVSRLELASFRVLDLGRRPRDRAHRRVPVAQIVTEDGSFEIACVHMSHLIHGSPMQIRTLYKVIGGFGATRSRSVIGGDMNCWGPPLRILMPGWREAVKGRTWPAWRPHSQLDHVLVGRRVEVLSSHIGDSQASDHLPVVSTISLR